MFLDYEVTARDRTGNKCERMKYGATFGGQLGASLGPQKTFVRRRKGQLVNADHEPSRRFSPCGCA
jgi:hypothetical protein